MLLRGAVEHRPNCSILTEAAGGSRGAEGAERSEPALDASAALRDIWRLYVVALASLATRASSLREHDTLA
jgi:hypothetical protein